MTHFLAKNIRGQWGEVMMVACSYSPEKHENTTSRYTPVFLGMSEEEEYD